MRPPSAIGSDPAGCGAHLASALCPTARGAPRGAVCTKPHGAIRIQWCRPCNICGDVVRAREARRAACEAPAAPERQQACPARRTSPDSQGASPWARVRGALSAKTRGQPPTHDGQNLAQETMTALAVQSTSKAFRSSQKDLLRKLCAVAYDLRKRRILAPFCAPLKTYDTQRQPPTQKGQNPRRTTASARLGAGSPQLPARLRLRRVCCQEVAYAVTSAEP